MIGHLCRVNDSRIPKIIYECKLEERRRRGQPISWKLGIHQIVRNLDMTTDDAQVEIDVGLSVKR